LDKMEAQYGSDKSMRLRAFEAALKFGRDNARTPMQWSAGSNAGFSNVDPWIRVNENHAVFNVEDQTKDVESVLSFWRHVLRTRKLHKDALIYGAFSLVDVDNERTITFIKSSEDGSQRFLVALNFSDQLTRLFVPDSLTGMKLNMQLSTISYLGKEEFLGPWEGRLYVADTSNLQ
jgi:glycosidase